MLPLRSAWALAVVLSLSTAFAGRVKLDPSMVKNEAAHGAPEQMVDEQTIEPPAGKPQTTWTIPSQFAKTDYPASAYIDLGSERNLSGLWIYDTNGKGDIVVSAGKPDEWTEAATYDCGSYQKWVQVPLAVKTRYLRITKKDGGSNFAEIALDEMTDQELAAAQAKKAADEKALADKAAADAKRAQEREAGMARAKAEAAKRQVVDLGDPFGQATLVDEIDVAAADPGHMFKQAPADTSKVEQILGKPARVLPKTSGESSYITFRIGQYKLLKPGSSYVLEVEYPEDAPRSWIVLNSGNESSMGFHTGETLGDAYRAKYVNSNVESVATPLSGKYETWRMFFNLHDHFCDTAFGRGDTERPLTPEDGFTVTIAQFSAENIPASHGAAVSKIRLYEVKPSSDLAATYKLPEGLPQRHIFWREEMADNVISAAKSGTAGLADPLDWYRFKANQMQFLGINTYSKDLLEFGAVQHWDTSAHGGHRWAYFDPKTASLWTQIVQIMGERGYSVFPYYEYSGSKGQQGLGPERRAKPLTRDDAFTHIKWIESANADITDPDTYEDFKKMLDITIVREKSKAKFVGAWIRPRSQIPMSFADATRKRFADEANDGTEITRQQLRKDPKLLERYKQWWYEKRRQFLVAMRDYLRENGIDDATILFTANPGEPGVSFPTWDPILVTDNAETWKKRLAESSDEKDKKTTVLSIDEVVQRSMYRDALLTEPKTWGDWEVNHAAPPADPADYKQTEGVLMSYAFNRNYTVASPEALEAFRAPTGLALMRHYPLNENMIFDKQDKPILGYFCADVERAGPYCMMAEAIAMANGDPTHIGYLRGRVFARGFPKYVRDFNTAFLSLPALPSEVLKGASADAKVVVRAIKTPKNGTYFAIVNTDMTSKDAIHIKLPAGKVTDAATGAAVSRGGDGTVTLSLYPFQLRSLHVE